MTKARREFIVEVSFVVLGSANAIRGLLVGNAGLTVGGLILLALVVARLALGPALWRLFPRFLRRPPRTWTRRVFLAVWVSYLVADAIRCVTSANRHDWGACAFYAVLLPADSGLLYGVATWTHRRGAASRQESAAAGSA